MLDNFITRHISPWQRWYIRNARVLYWHCWYPGNISLHCHENIKFHIQDILSSL